MKYHTCKSPILGAGLLLGLICAAASLTGCGQKGPLILPPEERTAPAPPAHTPAETEIGTQTP